MPTPYSIKIYLPAGEPNGLRVLERPNWAGIGIAFSRTGFKEAAARPELASAGVYILVGEPSDDSTFPTLYIGEGDPILDRLKNHNANKDFWTSAIAFTSKDTSLNKAHIQHLESRLIEIARQNRLCKLENSVNPTQPSLTESDCADVEQFLETLLSILPLLGISAFKAVQIISETTEDTLFLQNKGIKAQAVQTPSGFVVLKGSEASPTNTEAYRPQFKQTREDLFANGLLQLQDEKAIFIENVTFSSPSTAACIVVGRHANGQTAWKNAQGVSLKELQAEE